MKYLVLLYFFGTYQYLLAQEKIFEKEYRYQASENDSRVTARKYALVGVKTLALEEAGTIFLSKTEMKSVEAQGKFSEHFKNEINEFSGAVTRVQVLEESWDGSVFFIKAKITLDTSLLDEKMQALVEKYLVSDNDDQPSDYPAWLRKIGGYRIERAKGIGPIVLGMTKKDAIDILGTPTRIMDNEIHLTVLYQFKKMMLGLYFNEDGKLESMRLSDDDLNADQVLPILSDGIGIGTKKEKMEELLGVTLDKDRYICMNSSTCSGDGATEHTYFGANLHTCDCDNKVYIIDINKY